MVIPPSPISPDFAAYHVGVFFAGGVIAVAILVTVEGMQWGPEAALRGATECLTPILMTALVTALGLLPLALGAGAPGREIKGPMAMVILGGLFTSTMLNLLILPGLALRYNQFVRSNKC